MEPWRLIEDGDASPARNMAVDEALLREVQAPVLRIYGWNIPAISLGYFQPAVIAPVGRPYIRRYTGGGLVDHAHDVTYTIVLPRAHPWLELSAPASYEQVHLGVQAALAACGIVSELAPTASAAQSEACFQKPVLHDVVADDAKLSGAAQRRTREGMLHQGSILLPDPARNADLRRGFANAFAHRLDLTLKPSELTPQEEMRAGLLERDRYATEGWNRSRSLVS
jgi:lipoate-protein ligase A